jgi:hypothetical protein
VTPIILLLFGSGILSYVIGKHIGYMDAIDDINSLLSDHFKEVNHEQHSV